MTSQQQEETRRRIVVGVDGSEGSRTALRWAAEEAELHGTELHAVYAYQPPLELPVVSTPANPLIGSPEVKPEVYARRAEEALEETIQEVFGDRRPARLAPRVLEGPPAAVLVAESTDADLLAVGPRGHGGFAGLLTGSVTDQVVRHARCSVVVVRTRRP